MAVDAGWRSKPVQKKKEKKKGTAMKRRREEYEEELIQAYRVCNPCSHNRPTAA